MTAEGAITYSEVLAHLDEERRDDGLSFNELIDAIQATVVFGTAEVRLIIDRLRELGSRDILGPTAVVVGNDVSFGMLRMLGVLVNDVCDIQPFRNLADAERWLDVYDGDPDKRH